MVYADDMVYTVDIVYTVDMVYTVETVDTVDTVDIVDTIQTVYESFATVGEIRVQWRADFQSGSRVLKKVF